MMRYTAKESSAAPGSQSTAVVDEPVRRIVLFGGLSLYHTALQWLIENRSHYRVVLYETADPDVLQESDFVLLDVDLDTATTARLAEVESLLKKIAPRPVLLVSAGVDPDALQALLRHGVAGVVLKTKPCDVLLDAVESVGRGKVWLQRDVLVQAFAEGSHARRSCSEAEKISHLTSREREIIAVACCGLANRQISDRLMISEATVRHHLSSIFAKLGVASRAELIVFAYRHKLADGNSPEEFC